MTADAAAAGEEEYHEKTTTITKVEEADRERKKIIKTERRDRVTKKARIEIITVREGGKRKERGKIAMMAMLRRKVRAKEGKDRPGMIEKKSEIGTERNTRRGSTGTKGETNIIMDRIIILKEEVELLRK